MDKWLGYHPCNITFVDKIISTKIAFIMQLLYTMVKLKVEVNFRFRSKKSKVVGPNTLFIESDNFRISGGETEAPRLQSPQDFQEASEVLLPGQGGVGGD